MALLYTFPSGIYEMPPPTGQLDEINILLPVPGSTLAIGTQVSAKFQLRVNSVGLTGVSVRLTMTRHQPLTGANPVSPTGPAWGFVGTLGEASWVTPAVLTGTTVDFEVTYTPAQAGAFTYSFSVDAHELRVPAITQVDVNVT